MIEVIPLKYGVMFKHAFSIPEVFMQFVKDVLDIEISIDKVYTEYEYPQRVGFVRSRFDLFAEDKEHRIVVEIQHLKEQDFFDRFLYYHLISMAEQVGSHWDYRFERAVYTVVVLTSTPRNGSVNFSIAAGDMNPVDEHGIKHALYPHRLVFLCPQAVNEKTPAGVKKWLELIKDSLDGQIEENAYPDKPFQTVLTDIRKQTVDPDLLAEIKDDAAWEKAKEIFREEGEKEARLETARKMLADGMAQQAVLKYTGLKPEDLL